MRNDEYYIWLWNLKMIHCILLLFIIECNPFWEVTDRECSLFSCTTTRRQQRSGQTKVCTSRWGFQHLYLGYFFTAKNQRTTPPCWFGAVLIRCFFQFQEFVWTGCECRSMYYTHFLSYKWQFTDIICQTSSWNESENSC